LRARLDALCRRPLGFAPAESLRARLMRTRERLWVFLDYREVEPTNNEAERSLRPSVIMRKITFGNRSDEGAQTHSILMSLMETAKRQGRDPRKFLCKLLTCGPRAAQAALYRDTS
jgi:transposase